jgi:predicted dehydrogenase
LKPRLGFLGLGWIGRHRLQALAEADAAYVVAICDPDAESVNRARDLAPDVMNVPDLDALLGLGLDGIVIATPSALHAEQSIRALERGLAVFCQKPLARTADETQRVIEAARAADRRLGVDMSYRFTKALQAVRDIVRSGEIGEVYAADLVFHNAYGPGKTWARDMALSGGGCAIDLGIHLVDAALWVLGPKEVRTVQAWRYARGRPLAPGEPVVEDYATAQVQFDDVVARLACSWDFPSGQDAVIEIRFWGAEGGASLRNVNGSFYDFVAERHRGSRTERVVEPPDAWGGGAAIAWAKDLVTAPGYDPEVEQLVRAARVIDAIQGR